MGGRVVEGQRADAEAVGGAQCLSVLRPEPAVRFLFFSLTCAGLAVRCADGVRAVLPFARVVRCVPARPLLVW